MISLPSDFTLTLIRHAQTPANVDGTFCGARDVPLTASGVEMAELLHLNPLASPAPEIWCSPFQRTRDTALALAKALKVQNITEDPRLRERSFGTWEGRQKDRLANTPAYKTWYADPYHARPPYGETGPEVLQRLLECIGPALIKCSNLIVVTHKTPARLLSAYLGGSQVESFRTLDGFHVSSVTRISARSGQDVLVEGPNVDHLPISWRQDPDRINSKGQ